MTSYSPAVSADVYPIRTVCNLTGVHPVTLRAWERRYGLVAPRRGDSGHRTYSQADIDTIERIVALARQGVALGRMREALAADAPVTRATKSRRADPWAEARQQMAAAIARFDEPRLETVYEALLALHPIERVTRELLMPLLSELGVRWRDHPGGIAEEHFFALYLRNKLGARLHHRELGGEGPRLLLACLPGEHHELGLLLFALAAHQAGYRLVMLGADMPLEALAHAARCCRADAVVLSGSVTTEPELLEGPLRSLVQQLGVPVLIGGNDSMRWGDRIAAAGARPLGIDMNAALRQLGEAVAPASSPRVRPRPAH